MKKNHNLLLFSVCTTVLFFLALNTSNAQDIFEKTIDKSADTESLRQVNINAIMQDFLLEKSSAKELKVSLLIKGELLKGKLEDFEKSIQPTLKKSGESLTINFQRVFTTVMVDKGKTIVKLSTGKKFEFKSLFIVATVSLPEIANLNITANFSKLKFKDNFTGGLDLNIQSGDFVAKNLGDATIKAKFSNLNLEQANKVALDLTNSTLNLSEVTHLNGKNSFSHIKANKVESVNLISVSGEINIEVIQILEGDYNFSQVKIDKLEKEINVKCQNGLISIKNITASVEKINLDATYTTLDLLLNNKINYSIDLTNTLGTTNLLGNLNQLKKMDEGVSSDKIIGNTGKGKGIPIEIECNSCEINMNQT